MTRLPIGRVQIERFQKWPYMRVPDYILKSVGFVAEYHHSDSGTESYDHEATGFFVSVPSSVRPGHNYLLFVTAKHVAEKLKNRRIAFIVNKKGGGVTTLTQTGDCWFVHPTDGSVDAAVLPFNITPDLDIL